MEHKNGRPTIQTQNQIKNILLQCFEDHLEPYSAAKKTGLNLKTVYKYYRKWTAEIEESAVTDFIERQKLARIQSLISYDFLMDENRKLLSQINLEIEANVKEKKLIPRHLPAFKLEVMKFRALLVEKKNDVGMKQTIGNDAFENKVREIMEKYDQAKS